LRPIFHWTQSLCRYLRGRYTTHPSSVYQGHSLNYCDDWCGLASAALRLLHKVIGRHGVPEKVTIDKSGANTAAIASYNADHDTDVEIRQLKYLNNIVEQDHRVIKRMIRAMMEANAFWPAAITSAGGPGSGANLELEYRLLRMRTGV
jgi:DDE domain